MTPEIRRIGEDDLPAFIDSMSTGFLARPDVDKVVADVRPLWDLNRAWAAFEGGRIVGTYRTWPTELTVPGNAHIPGSSVTNVTVLPTHRRRGVLRGMVAAEHAASRERGEAVALLYASEYPIYGRFGYGPGCFESTWTLDTRATSFHGEPAGTVELATPSPETRDLIKGVYDAWRVEHAGEIRRRDSSWDFDLGLRESAWDPRWKGFLALHRDASGVVDGYARYRSEDKWENHQPRNMLLVDELHALDDEAYLALWRYLADIDWVATVKAERRSPFERLRWFLTNARAAVLSDVGDGMWVRLFDVSRALETRTYEREGNVVLELVDPEATGGRTRIQLDATGGRATARPSRRSPDLTL
ncbi:MAG TPA: GNAT family N-acetyltransferase, partial [Candidatus Limnocylindrales bacterium]|nr:GNAT family N-acetyltransferase [Candidatus Limnocylindrales bacterium]